MPLASRARARHNAPMSRSVQSAPGVEDHPLVIRSRAVAHAMLADQGTRHAHVRTAGSVAARLSVLFDEEQAALLVAAATVHDVGYAPRVARTGFHPFDGAVFLLAQGFPQRLAALVAHHSVAELTPGAARVPDLHAHFPAERGLLADSLAYADMHSAPDGRILPVEHRLADIARRHADPSAAQRAGLLRAAMTRVGAALLAAAATGGRAVRREADPMLAAFQDWWAAEADYTRELATFPSAGAAAGGSREAAVRLAHLRSLADRGRDRFFRLALADGRTGAPASG